VRTRLQLTAFIVSVSAALALPLTAAGHDRQGGENRFSSQGDHQFNSDGDHRSHSHDYDRGNSYPDDQANAGDDQGIAGDGEQTALSAPQAPTVGEDLNVVLESGSIRIKLPGSGAFVALGADASIPVGSVVDARAGKVTLTTAHDNRGVTQSAAFTGSIFKVTQKPSARPVTKLRLRGGDFGSCPPTAATASVAAIASVRRSARRSLWGSGHGRFRTIGRHGAATVRGTIWRTTDRCDGTLVRVRRGLVRVRDFSAHKTVLVSAGHSHLARAVARH
jgi:hypothetical protein